MLNVGREIGCVDSCRGANCDGFCVNWRGDSGSRGACIAENLEPDIILEPEPGPEPEDPDRGLELAKEENNDFVGDGDTSCASTSASSSPFTEPADFCDAVLGLILDLRDVASKSTCGGTTFPFRSGVVGKGNPLEFPMPLGREVGVTGNVLDVGTSRVGLKGSEINR